MARAGEGAGEGGFRGGGHLEGGGASRRGEVVGKAVHETRRAAEEGAAYRPVRVRVNEEGGGGGGGHSLETAPMSRNGGRLPHARVFTHQGIIRHLT